MPIFPGNTGSAGGSGSSYVPDVVGFDDDGGQMKLSEDAYEVFVNGDKVGNKIMLTQTDNPEDLEDYLKDQGFKDFKAEIVGGHIHIEANEESHKMKEILSSYLDIR